MEEFTKQISTYSKDINLKTADRADLYENRSSQIFSLLEEWKKLLLHSINVNICGNNISGVLTHVQIDHIIIVSESHVYIIPAQNVAFICYNIKEE